MPKPFYVHTGLHDSIGLNHSGTSMNQANELPGVSLASASGVDSPIRSAISTDFGSLRLSSMSALPSNEPFTVSEKVELLVNILQPLVADLPSYLLHLILDQLKREPQWSDIALPKGRTLHTCQIAFEEMRKLYQRQAGPPRLVPPTTYANIAPAPAGVGRSFSEQAPNVVARPPLQTIRPSGYRSTESPPVTNGESPVFLRSAGPFDTSSMEVSMTGSMQGKKRGRPSKADVEARDRKLAAEGKVWVAKKRPTKKARSSLALDAPEMKDEESLTPLLQTPSARVPEAAHESSSGKRRRRQLTRDESPPTTAGPGSEARFDTPQREGYEEHEGVASVAQSPSDRLLLSHRDRGSAGSSLSRPTHRGSEPAEPGFSESENIT